ncbi:MAG: imidazolonepropionase, partial [Planctomycetota bacterium]
MPDLLIRNAGQILTCAKEGVSPPLRGHDQGELGLTSGAVAVKDGAILQVGPEAEKLKADRVIDADGGVVLPGFVDC